jgi:hypothetical protein
LQGAQTIELSSSARVADRSQSLGKIRCDITGVGNYIVEDMING